MLHYRLAPILTGEEYEDLMNQGWRKFGPELFQPRCPACMECRPIRIPAARFRPNRSQRRAWKAAGGLQARIARPSLDAVRMELWGRYHGARSSARGWEPNQADPDRYRFGFLINPVPAAEITLWDGDQLRAVVLVDLTPNVVSGVYHYYDPEASPRGLGTVCMLQTIAVARQTAREWAYFGYYVRDCPSMAYKARFRPCELLGEDGVWRPFEEACVKREE